MRTYTEGSTASQAVIDTVEILELAEPFEPTVGWEIDFQRRLDARLTYSQLRQHVCLDYDLGCVNAVTSMQRLKDLNLFGNPDQFMAVYSAGVRALAGDRT